MNEVEAKNIYKRLDALEASVSVIERRLGLTNLAEYKWDAISESAPASDDVPDVRVGLEPAIFHAPHTRRSKKVRRPLPDVATHPSPSAPGELPEMQRPQEYHEASLAWPLSSLGHDVLAGCESARVGASEIDSRIMPAATVTPMKYDALADGPEELSDGTARSRSQDASFGYAVEGATGETPQRSFDIIRNAGFWLSKVGIVLFLSGVAFLFKYAVDRQWLSEQARVGTGLLLGTGLLCMGLIVSSSRRNLGQVLLGGGIATYYITGIAAYQLFPTLRIGYEQAFFFMSVVTLLAFVLSLRHGEVVLALIGLLGGLLTPFALGLERLQVPALLGYTCLLLAGTGAIYLFRSWRSLLWSALMSGWSMVVVGYTRTMLLGATEGVTLDQRWALQGTLVVLLLAFWVVPVLREVLAARSPARWPMPLLSDALISLVRPANAETDPSAPLPLLDYQAHLLSVLMPASVLASSAMVWGNLVTKQTWGWVALAGAALMACVFLGVQALTASSSTASAEQKEPPTPAAWACRRLGYVHAMTAIGSLTLGLSLLLEGNALLTAFAIEGVALHMVSRCWRDRGTALWGHAIFALTSLLLANRLLAGPLPTAGNALFNLQALTDLLVMSTAVGVSFLLSRKEATLAYRGAVHLALMAWLWRELQGFPDSDGYIMLAWAAYGLLLHFASYRLRDGLNSTGTSVAAHIAFEGSMGLLALRLTRGFEGSVPMFNSHAALDLVVMGMALASSFVVKQKGLAAVYRLVVHTAMLGWLWRESTSMDQWWEHGYLMLRWAIYLMTVALISHRLRDRVTLIFAGVAFAPAGAMLGLRILSAHDGTLALLNTKTLVDVAVLSLAFVTSLVVRPPQARRLFQLLMHGAVLGVLWRELSYLPRGINYVLLAWAVYAVLLAVALEVSRMLLKGETTGGNPVIVPHLVFALSGLGLLGRIAWGLYWVNEDQLAVFNPTGLSNLGVIAAGLVMAIMLRRPDLKHREQIERVQRAQRSQWLPHLSLAYLLWLHVAFLGWTWQELGLIPHGGNGYVTIAWGAYAIVLVLVALNRWSKSIMSSTSGKALLYCGISTLFLVAGKLFLIDLRYLDAIWRILLFLGFGGLFLFLSYFFQGSTKSDKEGSQPSTLRRGSDAARG